MALSDILEAIDADSRETAARIIYEAGGEVDRILTVAREEAAAEEQRLAASLDDQARLERSRVMSRAHLEAARDRRADREGVYRSALEGVRLRIEALRRSPEYRDVLISLIEEAIAVLPEATTVVADPDDVGLVETLVEEWGLNVRVEARECPLGGVVVGAKGRSVDNTLNSRLRRADEHLRFIAGELIPSLRGDR